MTTNFSNARVNRDHRTFDGDLELNEAGLVTASAAGLVDAAAKILDLGTGLVKGVVRIDVLACEVDTGDELYIIGAQFSSVAAMTSVLVEGPSLHIGDATVLPGDIDIVEGQYMLPVTNNFDGTLYRYMRLYHTIAGTVVTGLSYSAYLAKEPA